MEYYFAPLEGITGYLYRNLLAKHFMMANYCVTPFIAPNQMRTIRDSDLKDVLPENNQGLKVIPQLIGSRAEEIVDTALQLKAYGYDEVNLNFGCPSSTVVAKKKGAGMLRDLDQMKTFLDEVYSSLHGQMEVSVKTRIGLNDYEDWGEILDVYNLFPISMLTVHCRYRKEFYKGVPHKDAYQLALEKSKNPVCYNGDIFDVKDRDELVAEFPNTEAIMVGRGMIANPALIEELTGSGQLEKKRLKDFLKELEETYREAYSGDVVVLNKMKEIWNYMLLSFDGAEGYKKEIGKCKSMAEYRGVVNSLFAQCDLKSE